MGPATVHTCLSSAGATLKKGTPTLCRGLSHLRALLPNIQRTFSSGISDGTASRMVNRTRRVLTLGHRVVLTGPLLSVSGVVITHCHLKGGTHGTVNPSVKASATGCGSLFSGSHGNCSTRVSLLANLHKRVRDDQVCGPRTSIPVSSVRLR